jgi:transposase-like protein
MEESQQQGSQVVVPNGPVRKSYTLQFKIKLAKLAKKGKITKLARDNNVSDRLLRKWISQWRAGTLVPAKQSKARFMRRQVGGGRKPTLGQEREAEIYDWVVDCREHHLVVTRHMVMEMARGLAAHHGIGGKYTDMWLGCFLRWVACFCML